MEVLVNEILGIRTVQGSACCKFGVEDFQRPTGRGMDEMDVTVAQHATMKIKCWFLKIGVHPMIIPY